MVPMPTRPFESMMKAVEVAKADVEELIAKSGAVCPVEPANENLAQGVDEPMPTYPVFVIVKADRDVVA